MSGGKYRETYFDQEDFEPNLEDLGNASYFRIGEQYVARAEFLEVTDKLKLCYLHSGVNHFEDCKHLVDEYYDRVTKWKALIPYDNTEVDHGTKVKLRVRTDPSQRHGYSSKIE